MAPASSAMSTIHLNLSSVVVIATEDGPSVLISTADSDAQAHQIYGLPESPFSPDTHRTFEEGIRTHIRDTYKLDLGYVEQLYTFGDQYRNPTEKLGRGRSISIGYVALTRKLAENQMSHTYQRYQWEDWYSYFPWEDWRLGRPSVIDGFILPKLEEWIRDGDTERQQEVRRQRVRLCFGKKTSESETHWNNERVLERYELLYSANMIPEARRKKEVSTSDISSAMGRELTLDHRRILATAISRIRAKIKYRPVIFELVPPHFTLFYLQQIVESLAGIPLHKQNFRRLVEAQGLVERTREYETTKRGRPAELFKFRSDVVLERPAPGVRSGFRSSL